MLGSEKDGGLLDEVVLTSFTSQNLGVRDLVGSRISPSKKVNGIVEVLVVLLDMDDFS